MKKSERKKEVQAVLQSDELLYQNKLTVKRIMNPDEPLDLVQSLGVVSNEVLSNLTGATGRRSFSSLTKNRNVKHCKIYGAGNRSLVNAIYTDEDKNQLLSTWQILGQAMWLMREQGMRMGRVKRITGSNDLATTMLLGQNQLLQLQFRRITEKDWKQPITAKPGYTLVMVFDSFNFLETTVNQHNNQFGKAINDGCFLISISNVQDFEVMKGLILSVTNDDEAKVKVTHLTDITTVNQVDFKKSTTPDNGLINQLNWEYDSAITNRTTKIKQKEESL